MSTLHVGLVHLALVAFFVASGAGHDQRPVKCGAPDEGPLLAVDGEITGESIESFREFDRENIAWLQVVCLDPRDSTFNRSAGIGVVSVWTKDGPAGRLEPTLASVLDAQDEHFRRNATYLGTPADLDLPDRPDEIELSVTASADGWMATAEIDRLLGACFVFGGDLDPPHPEVDPREPTCLSDRDLERHAGE